MRFFEKTSARPTWNFPGDVFRIAGLENKGIRTKTSYRGFPRLIYGEYYERKSAILDLEDGQCALSMETSSDAILFATGE